MTTMQLDSDGRLRHLLTLEGLPRATLLQLLDRAGQIRDAAVGRVGKRSVLAGTAVCTLFFEPSTRTRSSFHLAAQRLGQTCSISTRPPRPPARAKPHAIP